jgi:ATP-binding cassette subfamily B protein
MASSPSSGSPVVPSGVDDPESGKAPHRTFRSRLAAVLSGLAEDQRARLRQVQLLAKASPWRAAAIGLLMLASMVANGGVLVAMAMVVGGIASLVPGAAGGPDTARLWQGFILMAVSLMVGPVFGSVSSILQKSLDQFARAQRNDRLARILLGPHGIQHLDAGQTSSRATELIEQARSWQILTATDNTITVLGQRVGALAPLVVVAIWNPWAALILVAVAVFVSSSWIRYLSRLLEVIMYGGSDMTQRRFRYMFQLAGGAEGAKEVRLFGMLPWIRPRLAGYERGQALFTAGVPGRTQANGAAVVEGIALMGVILVAVHDALGGTLDVGRLAAIFTAGIGILDGLGPIGDPQQFFLHVGRFERSVDELGRTLRRQAHTEHAASTESGTTGTDTSAPDDDAGSAGIAIRDLAFRYPGRDQDTLHGLDLTIPAGQSVGVVGVNGAGKSTLMSLIAGLENPTVGSVQVGGSPAGPPPEGEPRVAVILQDFTRYPLDVRDNITLGREVPDPAIRADVTRAGGGEVLERLDRDLDGLGTTLSPGFSGGTDLSGGQWQRLAIARALSAVDAGAQVLVLDEPTSALDVRAEAALFDDFLAVTRGVTTLLVSHRLSSVRRTERIIVVDDGRIVEDGSHEELLLAGGQYAQMFTLQAERFAQAGGDEGDDTGNTDGTEGEDD